MLGAGESQTFRGLTASWVRQNKSTSKIVNAAAGGSSSSCATGALRSGLSGEGGQGMLSGRGGSCNQFHGSALWGRQARGGDTAACPGKPHILQHHLRKGVYVLLHVLIYVLINSALSLI